VPKVFINYRVQDQVGYAALLDRALTERFGRSAVFYASRSIQPGEDFPHEIMKNLRESAVVLAVIGPNWLAASGRARRGRVGGEQDWVLREISEALSLGIRVIPVLVEGAPMPAEEKLPKGVATIARRQYLRLHHRSAERDIARLVAELRTLVPELCDQFPDADGSGRRSPEVADTRVHLFRLAEPIRTPCQIGIVTGTLHRVRCADIWVNSENVGMEMSRPTEFSISAIVRYWGARRDRAGRVVEDLIADDLAAKLPNQRPVVPGTAVVTGAGALTESNNVHHVIHVAAVQGEPGAGFRQIHDIGRCVTNALAEADRLAVAGGPQAQTILFPLLGTGVAGADLTPTVHSLLDAAIGYLAATPTTALRVVYFLAYTEVELAVLKKIMHSSPRLLPGA
jgi:O-acetyl-ADP-ribose deacetylase (regulator of RNase III)